MPADFFLVTNKIMRKNPHIKRYGTNSKTNFSMRFRTVWPCGRVRLESVGNVKNRWNWAYVVEQNGLGNGK